MTDFKKMDIVYELVLFMYHPSGWDSKYTRVYKIPGPILLFLKFGLPGVYWLGFRLRACRPKLGAVDANRTARNGHGEQNDDFFYCLGFGTVP